VQQGKLVENPHVVVDGSRYSMVMSVGAQQDAVVVFRAPVL